MIPIGKQDREGKELYEGDIVKLVPAIMYDLPNLEKTEYEIVRKGDGWYFHPLELCTSDLFSYRFRGIQHLSMKEDGETVVTMGPPFDVATTEFASAVILKLDKTNDIK